MTRTIVYSALITGTLIFAPVESRALTVSDANGVVMGEFVSLDSGDIVATTTKGFLVYLRSSTGEITALHDSNYLYYLDSECTGQLYVKSIPIRPVVFMSAQQFLQNPQVMYVNSSATPVAAQYYYRWTTIGGDPTLICYEQEANSEFPDYFLPVSPNDPTVTGLGNGPFVPPFKLSMRLVFEDGFDGV